jgi:hypothetical protein
MRKHVSHKSSVIPYSVRPRGLSPGPKIKKSGGAILHPPQIWAHFGVTCPFLTFEKWYVRPRGLGPREVPRDQKSAVLPEYGMSSVSCHSRTTNAPYLTLCGIDIWEEECKYSACASPTRVCELKCRIVGGGGHVVVVVSIATRSGGKFEICGGSPTSLLCYLKCVFSPYRTRV